MSTSAAAADLSRYAWADYLDCMEGLPEPMVLHSPAKAHGGPTVYTKATTPDWDGFYVRDERVSEIYPRLAPDRTPDSLRLNDRWQWGGLEQVPA